MGLGRGGVSVRARDDASTTPCPDPEGGWVPLDPSMTVLNVSTTGDMDAMEANLCTVWGGPLCVSDRGCGPG